MSGRSQCESLEIVGERGRKFSIALPRIKGEVATAFAELMRRDNRYHQVPHLGVFILDYLNGAGTLIDVGANIGLLSIPAAVYGSRVIAIELLPENALCLTLAALANRLSDIALFQLAAGADRGLVGSAGSEWWGHVVPMGEGSPAVMMPLDEVVELANLQRGGSRGRFVKSPVLIKIDTEGHELAVLEGARRTIERFGPDLIVECVTIEGRDRETERHSLAVKTHLEEQGYRLYLHRRNFLAPRAAGDLQESRCCDFFASRRQYREGERIGRFTVGPLDFVESVVWVAEMAELPSVEDRLHAVGVIARWEAEGRYSPRFDEIKRHLLDDLDPAVAEAAAQLRLPRG